MVASFAIAGAAIGFSCGADVVVIGPVADNTLYESAQGLFSNGAGQHFFAGANSERLARRGVIRFDIAAAVPAGAIITGVTLRLHLSQEHEGAQAIALHRLLASWGEGASDAPGAEGGGAPAEPGDATWIHRFFDDVFWDNPGGDFAAGASASALIGGVGFHEWSSNGMIDDVQSWLDTPGINFGWILIGNEDGVQTAKRFDSRENPIEDFRPILTIEYIPAPGGLAVLALAALARPRRRRSGAAAHCGV